MFKRQAKDEEADLFLLRKGQQQAGILGELGAPDGFACRGELPGEVARRHADGLGAEVKAKHALALGQGLASGPGLGGKSGHGQSHSGRGKGVNEQITCESRPPGRACR
jgi:hypothetical protein